MKRLIITLLTASAIASPVFAQSINLPPGTVYGRLNVNAGPGQAIPFATLYSHLLNCTSGTGACLDTLAGFSSTGILARTGTGAYSFRTITGTANEITATNGNGVSGNPTLSLPSALTFTGKTVTGGAFTGVTSFSLDDTGSAFNLAFISTVTGMSADRSITWDTLNGSRSISMAGSLIFGGNFTTSGASALTLTTTGATNVTLPTAGVVGAFGGTSTNTQNAASIMNLVNASTGTGAVGLVTLVNSANSGSFGMGGTGYTGTAGLQNRAFVLASAGTDGIAIMNAGDDPTVFYRSGIEIGRLNDAAAGVTARLGLPGTTTGSLALSGATSGTAVITAQAVAGTPTLTLPTTSGTLATTANTTIIGGSAASVNLNSVADTSVTITSPTSRYRVIGLHIENNGSTASLTTAQFGVFTGAGATGVTIWASGTALSPITTNAANTAANSHFFGSPATTQPTQVTLTGIVTLFFRVTQAQGAAATANIWFIIQPLP